MGRIQLDDVFVRDTLEDLDDTAQAIAVSCYEDVIVLHERGEDLVFPVGERTSDRVAERFGQG